MTKPSAAMRQTFKEMATKEAKDILLIMACFMLALGAISAAILYSDDVGPLLYQVSAWGAQFASWVADAQLPAVGSSVLVVSGLATLSVAGVTARFVWSVYKGGAPQGAQVEFLVLLQAIGCTVLVAYEMARLANAGGGPVFTVVVLVTFGVYLLVQEGMSVRDLMAALYQKRYLQLRCFGAFACGLATLSALGAIPEASALAGVIALSMALNTVMLGFGLYAEARIARKRVELLNGVHRKSVVAVENFSFGSVTIARGSQGLVADTCQYSEQMLLEFSGTRTWMPLEVLESLQVVDGLEQTAPGGYSVIASVNTSS